MTCTECGRSVYCRASGLCWECHQNAKLALRPITFLPAVENIKIRFSDIASSNNVIRRFRRKNGALLRNRFYSELVYVTGAIDNIAKAREAIIQHCENIKAKIIHDTGRMIEYEKDGISCEVVYWYNK